ncbi:hypothetical protein [Methylomicrobium sp. Wu6]|uniref:hypothetical protein n=1 Tax=Methylomicrobium sp. Wu6 TaxID=3107928 RepID=UPI002DD648F7|nr:hypothetical protein [Methylomicrobium sp. Wu6]MEC4749065.1 hypothetical protein [Methylomicrobium sp. Wu6]
MKFALVCLQAAFILAAGLSLSNDQVPVFAMGGGPQHIFLTTSFPTANLPPVTFDQAIIASPLLDQSQGRPLIVVPASNGVIAMLDAETGAPDWKIAAPAPGGQQTELVSTPVIVGDKLIIIYQCLDHGVRMSHRIAVIDMANKKLDEAFPVLELYAEKPSADGLAIVKFNPPTAYSHAALKHAAKKDGGLGIIYASFGNAGDTQPFHGWLFEIDLDAWRQQGANQAVTATLLTTAEAECPVTIESGTQEMICGGGIWTPPGPQIYPAGDSYEIFVPTGNGQVDLSRRDYANTLMRLKPGLEFDPGCDAQLCSNFDPADPDKACMASCKNLFIPRLADQNAPLKPASGDCENKSYAECLAWMDYDLGANAPVKATLRDGRSVLIQAGKDGGVSLLDTDHLGTQFDRLQIAQVCGAAQDPCKMSWAGMIVTQPVLSYVDDAPVVMIPTFVPDHTHPAGLVALKIVSANGAPKFKRLWQYPDPASAEAKQVFRSHPSLPVLSKFAKTGDDVVWIIDIGMQGTIYGIRVKDGKLLVKTLMKGTGRPLSAPVVHNDMLYAASTLPTTNQAILEGYKIEVTP